VERSNAWLLDNKRLSPRYDRLGFIVQALLQKACILLVAGSSTPSFFRRDFNALSFSGD